MDRGSIRARQRWSRHVHNQGVDCAWPKASPPVSLGLDTSVVLRLLTGEPAPEARAARARIERAYADQERVVVTDLVLAEAYFALHYHYGIPKQEARSHLRRMARSGIVALSPPEAVWALDESTGAGLVDRLIHARHRAEGAVTLTLDKKMAALEGAIRVGRR